LIEGLSELVDQEQRCGHYKDQNKKEDDPDSIGSVYLIVGRLTEEQSRQASCTLVRHELRAFLVHYFTVFLKIQRKSVPKNWFSCSFRVKFMRLRKQRWPRPRAH
jgi:hypothetical protein